MWLCQVFLAQLVLRGKLLNRAFQASGGAGIDEEGSYPWPTTHCSSLAAPIFLTAPCLADPTALVSAPSFYLHRHSERSCFTALLRPSGTSFGLYIAPCFRRSLVPFVVSASRSSTRCTVRKCRHSTSARVHIDQRAGLRIHACSPAKSESAMRLWRVIGRPRAMSLRVSPWTESSPADQRRAAVDYIVVTCAVISRTACCASFGRTLPTASPSPWNPSLRRAAAAGIGTGFGWSACSRAGPWGSCACSRRLSRP